MEFIQKKTKGDDKIININELGTENGKLPTDFSEIANLLSRSFAWKFTKVFMLLIVFLSGLIYPLIYFQGGYQKNFTLLLIDLIMSSGTWRNNYCLDLLVPINRRCSFAASFH